MRRFVLLCGAGLGVVLPACGSLDSNTHSAPVLATVQGNLLNPNGVDVSSSSEVRVAVVWRVGRTDQFHVAEDLPVQPVFPSAFTVAFDGPPPASAMNDASPGLPVIWCIPDASIPVSPECARVDAGAALEPQLPGETGGGPDGGGDEDAADEFSPPLTSPATATKPTASQYAVGTVVAYLDENRNGKLDLVAADASAYGDRILATNEETSLVYVQGPVTDEFPFAPLQDADGHRPTEGYNLLHVPSCNKRSFASLVCPSGAAADARPCGPPQWLPIAAPYPLTLATNPEVANLMCLTENGPATSGGSGLLPPYDPTVQPAQYPAPNDAAVCCASDGSYYLDTACVEVPQGLCKGTVESCMSVGYGRPTPAPTAWPCAK